MTKSHVHPFALRLIGYTFDERTELSRHFAFHYKHGGYLYHALHDDNLEDPDLYLVNVDAPGAQRTLERLRPAPLRPALLLGTSSHGLPYAFLPTPVATDAILSELDQLVAERADALARLDASEKLTVPERRRRLPLDSAEVDFADMRRVQREGGVLVVDKDGVFAQSVTRALAGRNVRVDRANDHRTATILCKQLDIALVFINTATTGLDPYRLCEAIRTASEQPITVIFLAGRYFSFHPGWARAAGCEGFVNRPVSERQLHSLLAKFLPPSRSPTARRGG